MTDFHLQIRDAVADALAALALGPAVEPVDDPGSDLVGVDLPAVLVFCVGPEQDRPEFATNARDGLGYPVGVALMGHGVTGGEKAAALPDLTFFRRAVREAFHHRRLGGVGEVCVCEVADAGPLLDKDSPAFQKLRTALVVVAAGRFPRAS